MGYSDWIKCKISDLGEIVSGGTPSTKNIENWVGEISWITPKDLSGYKSRFVSTGERKISSKGLANSSAKLMPKGSVLFSSRAPIGYVAIASNELSTNQGFKSIVTNKHNYNIFVYYLLKYITDDIKRIAGGSTFSEISGTAFKNIDITIPGLNKQKAIADILSSLDDKIELNQKINKNLEDIAQTLYKRWFVDFEFPNEEGLPYKSSGGEMVDSELGLIPKGWEVKTVGEIRIFNKRGISPKYTTNIDGIPVINQRCIRNHTIVEEAVQYHDLKAKNFHTDYFHNSWDVLVNSMGVGTLGRVSISSKSHTKLVHSCITILRTNEEQLLKPLFAYMILSFEKKFIEMGEGTTGQTSLNNKLIDNISMILPSMMIQKKLANTIQSLQEKIDNNYSEIEKLSKIRDLLLPKLMNGEIEVPVGNNHGA